MEKQLLYFVMTLFFMLLMGVGMYGLFFKPEVVTAMHKNILLLLIVNVLCAVGIAIIVPHIKTDNK